MIPNTFEECNEVLNKTLLPADQIEFISLSKDKIIITHNTLGRWIRNKWGLWVKSSLYLNMRSLGFRHPDDMSGTIIKEYWLYLNNLPSEVKEDIIKYDKHWREQEEIKEI